MGFLKTLHDSQYGVLKAERRFDPFFRPTLYEKEVNFDFMVQVQTDPWRMPTENASVRWPERLSRYSQSLELRTPIDSSSSKQRRSGRPLQN